MSARQLIVLAVAFIAAIGALLLIRGTQQHSAPAAAKTAPIAGERVLVATKDVALGVSLQAADIEWRLFPTESVTDRFVSEKQFPEAQTQFVGAVTRRPFVAGEPIIQNSVIQPDGRSAMAALVEPGYRAISVEVEPKSAAGGFIKPGDHVDVLLTTRIEGHDEPDRVRTDVVLQDVRVLALGADAQPPAPSTEAPAPSQDTIVVLALGADDARALEMANKLGSLSLSLRGVETEAAGMRAPSSRNGSAIDQAVTTVRVHAFGRVSNGGGG